MTTGYFSKGRQCPAHTLLPLIRLLPPLLLLLLLLLYYHYYYCYYNWYYYYCYYQYYCCYYYCRQKYHAIASSRSYAAWLLPRAKATCRCMVLGCLPLACKSTTWYDRNNGRAIKWIRGSFLLCVRVSLVPADRAGVPARAGQARHFLGRGEDPYRIKQACTSRMWDAALV